MCTPIYVLTSAHRVIASCSRYGTHVTLLCDMCHTQRSCLIEYASLTILDHHTHALLSGVTPPGAGRLLRLLCVLSCLQSYLDTWRVSQLMFMNTTCEIACKTGHAGDQHTYTHQTHSNTCSHTQTLHTQTHTQLHTLITQNQVDGEEVLTDGGIQVALVHATPDVEASDRLVYSSTPPTLLVNGTAFNVKHTALFFDPPLIDGTSACYRQRCMWV
jgi:hypothetical protein